MEDEKLEHLVLSLLEPGIYKTTSQVVEEFRMEYPAAWQQLESEGEMLFGKSCSSVQQPFARISRILLALTPEHCIFRQGKKESYWSKP